MKLIALDCDGVINSNFLIRKWIDSKFKELENDFDNNDELRKAVRIAYSREFCNCEELVFPELASIITKICKETDAKILWTSTWRRLERYKNIEDAKEMFDRRGLPGDRLIGYTPHIGADYFSGNVSRGSEIRMWLFNNVFGDIEKCAVIDDREDAGFGIPKNAKFFQIADGITKEDAEEICSYLNS